MPVLAGWEPADRVQTADDRRLDRVAVAFAHVIDARSSYTAHHSEGVAHYAVAIAAELGMDDLRRRDLRRAGRSTTSLAVSSRILDKPGRLDPSGFAQIRTHPHCTQKILERVACFRLAVADIYDALTADRPYRAAMPVEQALDIVTGQAGSGLCPRAVEALEAAVARGTAAPVALASPV